MKIGILNGQISYYLGGTERLIHQQVKILSELRDVDITIITTKQKNQSELYKNLKNNTKIKFVEFDTTKNNLDNPFTENNPNRWNMESFALGKESYQFLKENKFDLIITHFSTDSLFIPSNQKNILHLHGVPSEYSDICDLSLHRPDAFVSVSTFVKNGWTELFKSLKPEKIKVIYPGIDLKKFKNLKIKRDLDLLFVGRFIKIKGIYYLLEAINLINGKPNLTIIGHGPEEETIRKRILELGLEKEIKVLTNIKDEQLIEYFNRAKVAVFPSFAKEGMVLSMLEACACGCCVITSNACSMPEFIKNEKNGLLIKPKEIKDLSEKVELLLSNICLREELSKQSEADILNEWQDIKRVLELYEYYKEIANEKPLP